MPGSLAHLHSNTPTVCGRFRTLSWLRTPQNLSQVRLLVTRTVNAPLARKTLHFGARSLKNPATDNADAVTFTGLAGQSLCLHTADGDTSFTLSDAAGRPLWSRNAQGTVSTRVYEASQAGGRLQSLIETAAGVATGRMRERYAYAPLGESKWQAANLAGAQIEACTNAGIERPLSVSMTGQPLACEQRLLKPEVELPDWTRCTQAETEQPLKVSGIYDATGAPLRLTNACGVTSISQYAITGALLETRLAYVQNGLTKEIVTLRDIHYRADGVVLSQTAGNGVIDRYEYDPATQFLRRHLTERPSNHPRGPLVISDLHYHHDPVGNILRLVDKAADPQWHGNRQATGLREYTYDTLYRLICATGRERAPKCRYYSTDFSAGSVWAPYTESYLYDDGDNLKAIQHVGGAGNRTQQLNISEGSNRATAKQHNLPPDAGFLAGGLQKQLADGQALHWHVDNQLRKVTPVSRDNGDDDSERYHYADGGTRTRKIRTIKVSDTTLRTVTTYINDCEIRQQWLGPQTAPHTFIAITQNREVRLIEDRLNSTVHLRYSFSDHLGSVAGETDDVGHLVTREEYAPYGTTVGRDEAAEEVSKLIQRTLRYSGKEQDATGLYYYGWRYYQPGLGRWLSVDPGDLVDGINLFRFTRNNPITLHDPNGMNPGAMSEKAIAQMIRTLPPASLASVHTLLNLDHTATVDTESLASFIFSGIQNDHGPALEALQYIQQLSTSPTLFQDWGSDTEPDLSEEMKLHEPLPGDPQHFQANLDQVIAQNRPMIARIEQLTPMITRTDQQDHTMTTAIAGTSMFTNTYYPGRWIFEANFRDSRHKFFASDVAYLQYETVSQEKGFYGQLPSEIIRSNVINEETLEVMNQPPSEERSSLDTFIWNTPNGRSTKRIMDVFGLKATSLRRLNESFILGVKPKETVPWRPWL